MYRLIFADDEDQLRNLILSQINWEEIGFEVVGACNGKEVLEIIDNGFVPDALLTDVRMPFMDGLELCKELRLKHKDITTIVLSGHDEFSYVQESMQLGVSDYILKPIKPNMLTASLMQLKSDLDAKAETKKKQHKIETCLVESMPFLQQQYLLTLLYDAYPADMVNTQFEYLGINLSGDVYTVSLISYSEIPHPSDKFFTSFAVQNILQKLFVDGDICLFDNSGMQIIISPTSKNMEERFEIKQKLQIAIQQIYTDFSFESTASIGKEVYSLADLSKSYKTALTTMNEQVLNGTLAVYDFHNTDNYQKNLNPDTNLLLAEKISSVFLYEKQDTIAIELISWFDKIRSLNSNDISYLRLLCSDLINSIHRNLIGSNLKIDWEIQKKISHSNTLTNLQSIVHDYILDLKQKCDNTRKNKQNHIIDQALLYINENYSNPSLSLSKLAKSLFISPSYLSNLFKRHYEMNFIDYVTLVRIEKAKELLMQNNLKAYEIAGMVGYKDPQYFSNSFKKHVGVTPSDFRTL